MANSTVVSVDAPLRGLSCFAAVPGAEPLLELSRDFDWNGVAQKDGDRTAVMVRLGAVGAPGPRWRVEGFGPVTRRAEDIERTTRGEPACRCRRPHRTNHILHCMIRVRQEYSSTSK